MNDEQDTPRRKFTATVEALAKKADVRTRVGKAPARWRIRMRELSDTTRLRMRRLGRRG